MFLTQLSCESAVGVQQKAVLWLCSKEFLRTRSNVLPPPSLYSAEQFVGSKSILLMSRVLEVRCTRLRALFGNLQTTAVQQLVLLALCVTQVMRDIFHMILKEKYCIRNTG